MHCSFGKILLRKIKNVLANKSLESVKINDLLRITKENWILLQK